MKRILYITALAVSIASNAYAYDSGDFQIWNMNSQEVAIGTGTKLATEQEFRYGNGGGDKAYSMNLGGVQMLYTANGEKVDWASAKLPEPDLPAFMGATDERISRGLVSSLSRFTRHVNSSWAGGRLEDHEEG